MRRSLLVLAATALALAVGASQASAYKGFETPSHNIGCILTEQGATLRHPRPRLAHSEASRRAANSTTADSLFVGRQGRGEYGCVSDSAMGAGPVLPYGERVRKGRFVCRRRRSRGALRRSANGHGFVLSKQRVRVF